ncbi:DENN domain containing protein 2D [Entamoeba marina]
MSDKLVEDVVLLKCLLVDDKIVSECIYQHSKTNPDQPKIVFPFCFSEGETIFKDRSVIKEPSTSEFFSFMLTNDSGTRKYAFCLRFPFFEYPECICVIGNRPLTTLFKNILKVAGKLRLYSVSLLKRYLDDICFQHIPQLNGAISNIKFHHLPYEFINSDDSSYNNQNVAYLLKTFGASMLVDMVGYLLVERKFLFLSNSIQTLSETIMAFTSLLYPFQWQHVLIPVLPLSLITYCAAPMPFVIGVKKDFLGNVIKDCGKMDDTLMVDANDGKFYGRESYNIPLVFNSPESQQLKNALYHIQRKNDEDSITSTAIYNCFHHFFYNIFHTYSQFFKFNTEKQKQMFEMEEFKASIKETSIPNYEIVTAFEESQMCFMFFTEKEEQRQQNINFEATCPLLNKQEDFSYPQETLKTLKTSLGITSSDVHCKYCFSLIENDNLAAFHNGYFYHTNCFRCIYCGRLITGDVLHQELKCMMCMMQTNAQLPDDELAAKVGLDPKKRQKALKHDDLINTINECVYSPQTVVARAKSVDTSSSLKSTRMSIRLRSDKPKSPTSSTTSPIAQDRLFSTGSFERRSPPIGEFRSRVPSKVNSFTEHRPVVPNKPQTNFLGQSRRQPKVSSPPVNTSTTQKPK